MESLLGFKLNLWDFITFGALFLVVAGEFFARYGFYKTMLYAGLMIISILFVPDGIVGLPRMVASAFSRLRKRREAATEYGAS